MRKPNRPNKPINNSDYNILGLNNRLKSILISN